MTEQEKREKVIKGLGNCVEYFESKVKGVMFDEWIGESRKAIALLKAQEPRVMTFEEVKEKIGSGECVFTECEKEGQWVRYGNAKLSVDQGDSCIIAFLSSGSREDDPHAIWWWISYKNYNRTWRCWTIPPTYEQRKAVKWNE